MPRPQPPLTARATSPEVSCSGKTTTCRTPDGVLYFTSLHVTEATDIRARIQQLPHTRLVSDAEKASQTNPTASPTPSTEVEATDIRASMRHFGSTTRCTIGSVSGTVYPHEHPQSAASPLLEAPPIPYRIPHATTPQVLVTSTMIWTEAPIITTTATVTANALYRASYPCDNVHDAAISRRIQELRLLAAPDRQTNRLMMAPSASIPAQPVAPPRVHATDIRDSIHKRRL